MDDLQLDGPVGTGQSVYIKALNDGTVHICAGNGCEDGCATITREQAITLENWLTEYLVGGE